MAPVMLRSILMARLVAGLFVAANWHGTGAGAIHLTDGAFKLVITGELAMVEGTIDGDQVTIHLARRIN